MNAIPTPLDMTPEAFAALVAIFAVAMTALAAVLVLRWLRR